MGVRDFIYRKAAEKNRCFFALMAEIDIHPPLLYNVTKPRETERENMNNKKRIIGLLLAAVLLLSVLSGCKNEPAPTPSEGTTSAESKTQTTAEKTTAPSSFAESSESEQPQTTAASAQEKAAAKKEAERRIKSDIDLALWYVNEKKDNGSKVSYPYKGGKAAYSKLTKAQKKLYKQMLPKVKAMEPFEYTAEEHGYSVLDDVLVSSLALCNDHPEYGIYFDIEEVFENDMTTALKASYFLPNDPDSKSSSDTAAIKKAVQIFEEECNLIVESIPEDYSTYDKYRYLAAVISIRTSYDNDFDGGKQTSTAYGAIEGPKAICQGYATAFEYLCRKANLWCKQVSGISQGVSHAWNLVRLETGTYHVDVTWADADENVTLDDGWQRYFMLSQEQILSDHEIDDGTISTGTPLTVAAG